MLTEKLNARHLPEWMNGSSWQDRRRELLDLFSREEYGYTPAAPEKVFSEVLEQDEKAFANKAVLKTIRLTFDTPSGPFSFPYNLIVPKGADKAPVFIHIAFRPELPDKYLPVEEIIDHGYAVATFFYKDVTDDSANFDKLAQMYPRDEKTGWGKIGMWAFAASRVMDDLLTREEIDSSRVCVTGHSRLGKTALWCAVQDERIGMAIANESGCSGASLARCNQGETVERIATVFPYWFCGNYQAWKNRENDMPFDQHMLVALMAPRRVYVSSALEDQWADPENEFLSCVAASKAWEQLGVTGLVTPDEMPVCGQPLAEGSVGYHVRPGSHFHSRTDWNFHMAYRDRHGV